MDSKSSTVLVPGVICAAIGFLLFHVYGGALGLVLGFALGEHYHHHRELEAKVDDLQQRIDGRRDE